MYKWTAQAYLNASHPQIISSHNTPPRYENIFPDSYRAWNVGLTVDQESIYACGHTRAETGPRTDLTSQCKFGFQSHKAEFSWCQSCPEWTGVIQIKCCGNIAVGILPKIWLVLQHLKEVFCFPVCYCVVLHRKQMPRLGVKQRLAVLSCRRPTLHPRSHPVLLLLSTAQLWKLEVWNLKLLGQPFLHSSLPSQSIHLGKEWKRAVCLLLKTFQTFTYLHLE